MDRTNSSLLVRVRDKDDVASWKEFYGLYGPLMVRYAQARGLNRDAADEVMQECMALLARQMPQFKYQRSRGRFKGYLRTLVNNKITSLNRRRRPRQAATHELAGLRADDAESVAAWERCWRREHLAYCLRRVKSRLSADTISAFRLHVLKGWPVDRVCRSLNLTTNQVYLAKSRVTRRLRAEMKILVGDVE